MSAICDARSVLESAGHSVLESTTDSLCIALWDHGDGDRAFALELNEVSRIVEAVGCVAGYAGCYGLERSRVRVERKARR